MFQFNPRVPRGYKLIFCLLSMLMSPTLALHSAPVLRALEPRGAQQGKVFTLTLAGEGLTAGAEIMTSLPGTLSRLSPSADLPQADSQLPILVQLKEGAPVGLYPVRIRTEEGLSNVLLFSVGPFPEVMESESILRQSSERDNKDNNDSIKTAQKLIPPVTVNGTLAGPDQDYYRFHAKAGERLVFEVEARRAGSAIDPVLQILDASGKEIAANNDAVGLGVDARAEVTFSQSGDFYVLVHEARYSDQEQNFYRLRVGTYPYAEGIFPLGWQRGGSVEVLLFGGNLASPARVKPNLSVSAPSRWTTVSLPNGGSLPFLFRVGDLPEMMEWAEASRSITKASPAAGKHEQALPPSTVVNGRISRPGEIDSYGMSVTEGQNWIFELEAASLGTSRLLGRLAVYDAQTNKRVALAELGKEDTKNPAAIESSRNEIDPRLAFAVPKGVKEIIVSVEDLMGRGGLSYGYRLVAIPQPPDFTLELVTSFVNVPVDGTAAVEVLVTRRGYDGPIHLTIPDLPEDIIQEGGNIPAEFNPPEDRRSLIPGYLTLTAKPGARVRSFQLSVLGEAVSSETPIRRLATAPGMVTVVRGTRQKPFKAPWLQAELPVAIAKSVSLTIEIPAHHVRLIQGNEYLIHWKLSKKGQVMGLIKVDSPRLIAPIKDVRLLRRPEGMEYAEEGNYAVISTFATPIVTFDVVIDGVRMVDGKTERVVTASAVTMEIVQGYKLELLSEKVEIKKGGRFELAGKVLREPGFTGIVKVRAEDLPAQLSCSEVVIPVDQSDFRLVFQAGPQSQPGEFEVRLASSATIPERKDNQEYTIPEMKTRMIVSQEVASNQENKGASRRMRITDPPVVSPWQGGTWKAVLLEKGAAAFSPTGGLHLPTFTPPKMIFIRGMISGKANSFEFLDTFAKFQRHLIQLALERQNGYTDKAP